jgi:hypothetical protein
MVLRAWLLLLLAAGAAEAAPARHVRIATAEQGAIHVWLPAGYEAATAGIVVYVHGYYTDVDGAWRHHRLAAQFAGARVNALFIACEAPRIHGRPVIWTSLTDLLAQTAGRLAVPLPEGPVVAVGHSGAYRTIASWLDDERLVGVALIDGLYGEVERYRAWIDGSAERRFINIAELTRGWTEPLHAALPETVRFERMPRALPETARIIHVRSRIGHMRLLTGGVVLPRVLRALGLPRVQPAVSRGGHVSRQRRAPARRAASHRGASPGPAAAARR